MNSRSQRHTPMSTAELIELASADVAGVLDERERQRFELGFGAAPPHVQAHIRAEQHRATLITDFLPDAEPPSVLRGKVLGAVRQAAAQERFESTLGATLATDTGRRRGLLNTLPLWRAAAIACGTAALVLGGFAFQVKQEVHTLANYVQTNQLLDFFRSSPRLQDIMFAERMQRFAMLPAAPDYGTVEGVTPQASIVFDPTDGLAVLLCRGLPSDSEFHLVVMGADGSIQRRLGHIEVSGGMARRNLAGFDASIASTLAISAHENETDPGRVVLAISPALGDG